MNHPLYPTLLHTFADSSLLHEALTHPSIGKPCTISKVNYQRLEFLGDAVLGLVIAEMLLRFFPNEREGDLAKRHAALVCGKTLAMIAKKLDIGAHLKMTLGEESSGGKQNAANLENALEAIIGALYLDGELEASRRFIETYWRELLINMEEPPKDPKTALQEWAQGRGKAIPLYRLIQQEGPAHAPHFTIQVEVEGVSPCIGIGFSKREAQRQAAKKMVDNIVEERVKSEM